MDLNVIAKGMKLIEDIDNQIVTVVRIHRTKHYRPDRTVQVRFEDGHLEYYHPDYLRISDLKSL